MWPSSSDWPDIRWESQIFNTHLHFTPPLILIVFSMLDRSIPSTTEMLPLKRGRRCYNTSNSTPMFVYMRLADTLVFLFLHKILWFTLAQFTPCFTCAFLSQLLLSWRHCFVQRIFESGTFSESCRHNWFGPVNNCRLKISEARYLEWRNKWFVAFRNSRCLWQICVWLLVSVIKMKSRSTIFYGKITVFVARFVIYLGIPWHSKEPEIVSCKLDLLIRY